MSNQSNLTFFKGVVIRHLFVPPTKWVNMKYSTVQIIIGAWALCTTVYAANDGVKITPGLWEIKSSSHIPSMSQAIGDTVTRCIREDTIDPAKLLSDSKVCSISDKKVSGPSMSWNMDCAMQGMVKAKGRGEFTSSGDSAKGLTEMTASANEQIIKIKATWIGRRVGECPASP